jgi:hypothetical protein
MAQLHIDAVDHGEALPHAHADEGREPLLRILEERGRHPFSPVAFQAHLQGATALQKAE